MTDAVRSPRIVAGALVLLAALAYVVAAGLRSRGGLEPPPDPWLTAMLLLLGLWLAGGAVVSAARARVSAATLRRSPELPVRLDAHDLDGEAASTEPAWADPTTRTGWRALHNRALWPLVAALVLGLALALSLRVYAASDDTLARTGIRTMARVESTGWAFAGRGGRPVAEVSYACPGGACTATVTGPLPGQTARGGHLAVLVDPQDPRHVRAETHAGTSSTVQWWITLGGLVTVLLAARGVWRLVQAYRLRARLRREPWLLAEASGAASGRALLRTDRSATVVSGAAAGPLLVLPDAGRRVVALTGTRMTVLRLPATAAEGRRWLRVLEPTAPTPAPDLAIR